MTLPEMKVTSDLARGEQGNDSSWPSNPQTPNAGAAGFLENPSNT